jgi:hypothetical protein
VNAEPFSVSNRTACLGRIGILWRGDEAVRRTAAALADVGVRAEPVVYEDDVLDTVRAQLATFDGVLVWVNPIHEGRNRAESSLLDDLVGGHLHDQRYREAERLRRFKIDDEFDLSRLHHRELGGLLTLEDAIDVEGRLAELVV